MNQRILPGVLVLALAFAGCGGSPTAPSESGPAASAPSSVVAKIGEETITMAQLEEAAGNELRELANQRFELLQSTLNNLVSQKLVAKEAVARSISEQDLFAAEVAQKLQPPTEQEVQAFWEQVKGNVGDQTFESLKPRIEGELNNQKRQVRVREFLEGLRAGANVQIMLEPPRAEVVVPPGEPALGPENAPITIVEFSDFDCPFCKDTYAPMERVLEEYKGKVRFVYRDFPLAMHKRAMPASQAARCAHEQDKYWIYYRSLMEIKGDLSDEDLKKRATDLSLDMTKFEECYGSNRHAATVQAAMEDAKKLGVTGTPTFFINGRMLVGRQGYDQFKQIIEQELATSKPS